MSDLSVFLVFSTRGTLTPKTFRTDACVIVWWLYFGLIVARSPKPLLFPWEIGQ